MNYKPLLIASSIMQIFYLLNIYIFRILMHVSAQPIAFGPLTSTAQAQDIIIRLTVGLWLAIIQWINFILLLLLVIKVIKSIKHISQRFIYKEMHAALQAASSE